MLEGKNNWKAWLYLLPALILLGIFSFYPIIKSFIIAFIRDYNPVKSVFEDNIAKNNAAGLSLFTFQNFITVFKGAYFKNAIVNTLLIAFISVPSSVILSLLISVLLIGITKMRGFFQTLFFLPYVTSAMAVAMAFTVLFANTGAQATGFAQGPVNTVIDAIGLKNVLITQLDSMEWNQNGKANWYAYICVSSKAKVKDNTVDADYVYDNYVDHDQLDSKYKAYSSLQLIIGTDPSEILTEEEYWNKTLYSDTSVYEKYRYHFKQLGYIDWVGAYATWGSAIVVTLIYSIWAGMAFKILVFTGGLTSIDKQYYDAAKIDGTSKWRTFWRITVPMMSPLIVYILITSLIGSFKTYTSIVGLFGTEMGPAGSPGTMMTFVGLVYQYMGEGNELIHLGAAAAVTLFLIILVVTEITNRFTKNRVHY